jgi:PKD repeat protein
MAFISKGQKVLATHYEYLRNRANTLLGNYGTDQTKGYGQTLSSPDPSTVVKGTRVSRSHWASLVNDVERVVLHQKGVAVTNASRMSVASGVSGLSASFVNAIDDVLNDLTTGATNFVAHTDGMVQSETTVTRSQVWGYEDKTTISLQRTFRFSSADAARYFFNAGGVVSLRLEHNNTSTSQDTSWNALLSSAGTIAFRGGAITRNGTQISAFTGYHALKAAGSTPQAIYQQSSNGGSSTAGYLDVKAHINAAGTDLIIDVMLVDSHEGVGDSVTPATSAIFGVFGPNPNQNPSVNIAPLSIAVPSQVGASDWAASNFGFVGSPPVTSFTPSTTSGQIPLTVTFTNGTSGPGTITYAWDFGDGNTSTDTNPTHTFTTAGDRTVTLAATNQYGSSSHQITVNAQAEPAVVSTITGADVTEGQTANFTVSLNKATPSSQVFTMAFGGTSDASDRGTPSFSNGVTNNNGSLTVPSGVTSFAVNVPTVDDSSVEGNETLILTIGGVSHTVNIINNDSINLVGGETASGEYSAQTGWSVDQWSDSSYRLTLGAWPNDPPHSQNCDWEWLQFGGVTNNTRISGGLTNFWGATGVVNIGDIAVGSYVDLQLKLPNGGNHMRYDDRPYTFRVFRTGARQIQLEIYGDQGTTPQGATHYSGWDTGDTGSTISIMNWFDLWQTHTGAPSFTESQTFDMESSTSTVTYTYWSAKGRLTLNY